jgi:hypothetical protein
MILERQLDTSKCAVFGLPGKGQTTALAGQGADL